MIDSALFSKVTSSCLWINWRRLESIFIDTILYTRWWCGKALNGFVVAFVVTLKQISRINELITDTSALELFFDCRLTIVCSDPIIEFVHASATTLFRLTIYGWKKAQRYHTVRNLHLLSKNSTLISRENCRLGEKLVKMLGFCQNWIFGQKFDFSNSVNSNQKFIKNIHQKSSRHTSMTRLHLATNSIHVEPTFGWKVSFRISCFRNASCIELQMYEDCNSSSTWPNHDGLLVKWQDQFPDLRTSIYARHILMVQNFLFRHSATCYYPLYWRNEMSLEKKIITTRTTVDL